MFIDKVTIKQITDITADQAGLGKAYDKQTKQPTRYKSKIPGVVDNLSPAIGEDGRTITGFDEDSIEVNRIRDDKLREKTKKELKALRLSLEKALGEGTDLSATSSYWDDYFVRIYSDVDLVLQKVNPKDVIKYNILVANGYAIPSLKVASDPKFRQAKYYCDFQEENKKEEVSTRKKRDEARSKLLEISENKDLMIVLGQYLEGPKYTQKHKVDDLYMMLSDFISNVREPDNINKFLKAAKKSTEELQFKITIDKALRNKIIRFTDGYYQRGQVTLGKNVEEVYNNLISPEFASEFLSIKNELED